jgi:adenosylcobyric acid synthase
MNPVLLKPQSEIGAQVVVQGRIVGNTRAREYHAMKPRLMEPVLESFRALGKDADLVLVEGAGSASEVNLRSNDIANMGFARAANVPVVLIGDIERGGVIASLVGTRVVLEPEDAARIVGFLVNKFRGDPTMFAEGMSLIERHTTWKALGLVPYFDRADRLPAEDSQSLSTAAKTGGAERPLIVALAYPRISNFDDFDPLRLEPGVEFLFLPPGAPIPGSAQLVILPGSKATVADLAALRAAGWDIDLAAHIRRGGSVIGICGGYQMLGREISDPDGIEGAPGTTPGLGFLDVATALTGGKILIETAGTTSSGVSITGYEMHVGRTVGPGCRSPMIRLTDGRADGAVNVSGRVAGCYLHGLFASDAFRSQLLQDIGADASALHYEHEVEATLDALAAHLEANIDCDRILDLAHIAQA